MRTIKFLSAILISLAVAACGSSGGGGGGGGGAAPPDTTPPTVSSTSPAIGATAVAINSAITATFSEALTASTVNTTTFTIAGVTGVVSFSGTTATFTPSASLKYSTLYTATITTGVKDLAGNAMLNAYTWTFTTGAAPDTTPPTVSSTIPANNATGVAGNMAIAVTFSEPMMTTSISATTITLSGGITGTVSYSGTTATFTPSTTLVNGTVYTATVTTGVKDLAGNAMVANHVWTFTAGPTDLTPPIVSSTSPANNAVGVAVNSAISATFSKPILASTVNATTIGLKTSDGVTIVTGAVTYSGTTATFAPIANLAYSTSYTATITTGIKDLAGNTMLNAYTWTFTTGAAPDTIPPTVLSTNGAPGFPPNQAIVATFSEPVANVSTATFTLTTGTAPVVSVGGTVTYNGITATFTPSAFLANTTTYTATIIGGATGVKDLAGNALVASYTWTFTTGTAPDITPPTVLTVSPANAATGVLVFDGTSGVAVNTLITANFSEPLAAATVTNASFSLTSGTAPVVPVAGTVTYTGTTATFTTSARLLYSTLYTATITTAVTDLAGNAMTANKVWSFTTGPAPTITAISAGRLHTIALKSDGTLWSWGYNTDGELGIGVGGGGTGRTVPTMVGNATNWKMIAAGGYHNLALKTNGTLWAWGLNSNGQIGDGTTTAANSRFVPTQIILPAPALNNDWADIAAGGLHSVALKSNGTLWTWGYNFNGQLGDASTTDRLVPAQIGSATNWSEIAAGGNHTVAIQGGTFVAPSGTLWAWGKNANGQLGNGDITRVDKLIPTQIGAATWNAISAGGFHTLGLQGNTLYAWGSNLDGQLGITPIAPPFTVGVAYTIRTLGTGTDFTLIGAASNTVGLTFTATGAGTGTGTAAVLAAISPVLIGAAVNWTAISAGYQHSAGIQGGTIAAPVGTAWTWGYNGNAQIGNGTSGNLTSTADVIIPTQTPTLATTWTAVSAGDIHTKGLQGTALWAWGGNPDGQLGNNTSGNGTNAADALSPINIAY